MYRHEGIMVHRAVLMRDVVVYPVTVALYSIEVKQSVIDYVYKGHPVWL